MDETNGILQSGVLGAAGSQQLTSLGWCWIQTNYIVSHYRLELAAPQGYLFHTTISNWQAPRFVFYKKKGSVGAMLKVRLRSLAAEGGQTQELKTCLREYRLPQRATNGRNRVPKATFDQAGWHSLGDICRIRVRSVCIYLWGIQWCHLCGSPQYCLLSKATRH